MNGFQLLPVNGAPAGAYSHMAGGFACGTPAQGAGQGI